MTWYYLALISACFVALFEITEKKILVREHSFDFLATSSLFMAAMSLPMIFYLDVALPDTKTLLFIFIKSVFAVTSIIFAARSLRHMEVSEYSPLMNMSPIFLFFMSIFFLGETFTLFNVMGLLLIIFGAYIVELKGNLLSPLKKMYKDKYIHFLIFSFIFVSLSAIMDRFILLQDVSIEVMFFYNRIFCAVLLFGVVSSLYNGFRDITKVAKRSFVPVLVFSALYMAADYVYYMAVKDPEAKIALIIPMKRMSTLLVTVAGGEFFKEKAIFKKSVACLVMIAGVYFIII
ncbi:EamA family transporter [bacterium]|nr:EamA family transporter [bacterium]